MYTYFVWCNYQQLHHTLNFAVFHNFEHNLQVGIFIIIIMCKEHYLVLVNFIKFISRYINKMCVIQFFYLNIVLWVMTNIELVATPNK